MCLSMIWFFSSWRAWHWWHLSGTCLAFVLLMKGGIAVEPLAMGNGKKLFQETSHPLVGFLVGVDLAKMSGLNHTPLFGRKSRRKLFQPIKSWARTAS